MMLGLTRLRGVAAAVFAAASIVAAVSLVSSAYAFTQENLSTGGNSTRFADPNERVKNFNSQGSQPFGENGPTVQFGAGQAPYRPFAHGTSPPPPLINSGDHD